MKTHINFFSILMIGGLLLLTNCTSRTTNGDKATQGDDTTTMQGDNTMTDAEMYEQMSGDGEVLQMVMTVDMNEINAAEEARDKQLSQAVMDYANMMHTEHTKNLEKGRNLAQSANITTSETDAVQSLKEKGANTLSMLTPITGKDFERAYINAMIKDHQDALNMIDNQLIPAAQNEALRNHLAETRGHVAIHLERAKEVQANMQE